MRFSSQLSDVNCRLKSLVIAGNLSSAVRLLYKKTSPPISSSTTVYSHSYELLLQDSIHRNQHTLGKRIHAHIILTGVSIRQYLTIKLLILYSKSGDLRTAHILFDTIPEPRPTIPWNALISGHLRSGDLEASMEIYVTMRFDGVRPDKFTFASLFHLCARLPSLHQGRLAHGVLLKTLSPASNLIVVTSVVDMYTKCSSLLDGRRAFDESTPGSRNVIIWTAMISGYAYHGRSNDVLSLFDEMLSDSVIPNHITFLAVLSACVHTGQVTDGLDYFHIMQSKYRIPARAEHVCAVVDLLCRAARPRDAVVLIERYRAVANRHVGVWGAVIGGCKMHEDGVILEDAVWRLCDGGAARARSPEEVAERFVMVSNALARLKMWRDVERVREMVKKTEIRKVPGWSSVEICGAARVFFAGNLSEKDVEGVVIGLHNLCLNHSLQ